MEMDTDLVDKLLAGRTKPEQIIGEHGLLKQLTKALLERVLEAEMSEHLGYERHNPAGYNSGNSRNGKTRKKLKGDFGEIDLETPRGRDASFEPKMVQKGQTRFTGLDDKIVSLYARGMTVRDMQAHLQEMYGVEVSPGLISNVTDAVLDEVKTWQGRPLEPVYPILYLDAMYVKIRAGGQVSNRAVYVAIGLTMEGQKEVLGLWVSANEGAKFWLPVLTELKNRGVRDIFIACVDGLKGFPQAIETVFPQACVQLCVVHLVRASLKYVGDKGKKELVKDLREIYTAATVEEAERKLEELAGKWDAKHPTISQIWKSNWQRIIPFYGYPPEIRRILYTTNAIESLNSSLRKATKTRGSFPTEDAALKVLYLALKDVSRKWSTVQGWREALNRFQILWPDRMPELRRG